MQSPDFVPLGFEEDGNLQNLKDIEYAPDPRCLATLRLHQLSQKSQNLSSKNAPIPRTLNSRVSNLQDQVSECMKMYMATTIRKQRRVKNTDFETIFTESEPEKKERRNKNLKKELDRIRESDKYYSQKPPNQIQLAFPKDFNRKLDNELEDMRANYADVMGAQKLHFGERFEKICVDIEKMEQALQNIRCKNPKIVSKIAPVLSSMVVVNSGEIIEKIIDDLLLDEVANQTEIERLKEENQSLIEVKIKKNRIKTKMARCDMLGAWQLIETLESYKEA